MYVWLILAVLFAALETLAVSKNIQRLEYIAKPAVMVCLWLWLYANTGLHDSPFWFGVGILFSLAGDVLLMTALDRLFLFGLIAFLLAHFAYIAGFWEEITALSAWSFILLSFVAMAASRVIHRIVGVIKIKGPSPLILPVIVYGIVVSAMLYAALSTMYDPLWKAHAALFVSLGAFLFWISDLILAWNKFVTPIHHGRVFNMMAYHLGQIGLIAGVVFQFR